MANFITDSQFDAPPDFVPGKYADDAPVALLFTSGVFAFLAMLTFVLDGWENSVYLLLLSIWMEMLYICVEKR